MTGLGRFRSLIPFGGPDRANEPGDYAPRYRNTATNLYYFGHHKCATNWMRHFLRNLCRELRMNYLVYRGDNRTNLFSRRNTATVHAFVNSWPHMLGYLGDGDRAFHLFRDPRDALVSSYFSWKHVHDTPDARHRRIRDDLRDMDVQAGLRYMLDHCGYFGQVETWVLGADPRVLDIRYEGLVADQLAGFRAIVDHLGIDLPEQRLRALVEASSFRRLSGRDRGQEDPTRHLRKGVPGDWRNHFGEDGPLKDAVHARLGPLLERLGYPP